ncbi:MAG: RNA polymerase sigma factor [Pseudomonadota bacterium]
MQNKNDYDREQRALSQKETVFATALQEALGKALGDASNVTSIWSHLDAHQRSQLAEDFVLGVSQHARQNVPPEPRTALHREPPQPPPAVPSVPRGYPANFNPLAGFPGLEAPTHGPSPTDVIASALGGAFSLPGPGIGAGIGTGGFIPQYQPFPIPPQSPVPGAAPDPTQTPDIADSAAPNFWPLWIEQQDKLLKQCLKLMSGNVDDAQDALSEAMVKASVKFEDSMDDIRNHRAWLSRIVHNACIDLHRQNRRKAEYNEETHGHSDDALPPISGHNEPSPEENCLTSEMYEQLERALASLPEKLRRPLLMRCVQDRSYEDIALDLGLSNCAVRKRVQLARDQLRDAGIR